jgi:hypothetical protein
VNSLKLESECSAPGEQPKFLGIREQRVTGLMIFVLMGCSVFMTAILKVIVHSLLRQISSAFVSRNSSRCWEYSGQNKQDNYGKLVNNIMEIYSVLWCYRESRGSILVRVVRERRWYLK